MIKRTTRIRLRRSAGVAPLRGSAEGATGVVHHPNLNKMPWPPRGYSQATFIRSVQMIRQLPHSRQPSVISVTLRLPSAL